MNFYAFAIFDRVAGQFGVPQISQNEACAVRQFHKTVDAAPFKEDLDMYHIGFFNGETGCFEGLDKPVFVCRFQEGVDDE